MNAIHRACELVGGVSKMAALLNVAAPTVHQWVRGGRPIPPQRCPAVEKLTAGAVTRKELRPTDWHDLWPELIEAKPDQVTGAVVGEGANV